MQSITIMKAGPYELISSGNGLAYELINHGNEDGAPADTREGETSHA